MQYQCSGRKDRRLTMLRFLVFLCICLSVFRGCQLMQANCDHEKNNLLPVVPNGVYILRENSSKRPWSNKEKCTGMPFWVAEKISNYLQRVFPLEGELPREPENFHQTNHTSTLYALLLIPKQILNKAIHSVETNLINSLSKANTIKGNSWLPSYELAADLKNCLGRRKYSNRYYKYRYNETIDFFYKISVYKVRCAEFVHPVAKSSHILSALFAYHAIYEANSYIETMTVKTTTKPSTSTSSSVSTAYLLLNASKMVNPTVSKQTFGTNDHSNNTYGQYTHDRVKDLKEEQTESYLGRTVENATMATIFTTAR